MNYKHEIHVTPEALTLLNIDEAQNITHTLTKLADKCISTKQLNNSYRLSLSLVARNLNAYRSDTPSLFVRCNQVIGPTDDHTSLERIPSQFFLSRKGRPLRYRGFRDLISALESNDFTRVLNISHC